MKYFECVNCKSKDLCLDAFEEYGSWKDPIELTCRNCLYHETISPLED